jgi:hypothetical protein
MTNYTIDGNKISFVSFDSYKIKKQQRKREREKKIYIRKIISRQQSLTIIIIHSSIHLVKQEVNIIKYCIIE